MPRLPSVCACGEAQGTRTRTRRRPRLSGLFLVFQAFTRKDTGTDRLRAGIAMMDGHHNRAALVSPLGVSEGIGDLFHGKAPVDH